jgi:hypothetical protein
VLGSGPLSPPSSGTFPMRGRLEPLFLSISGVAARIPFIRVILILLLVCNMCATGEGLVRRIWSVDYHAEHLTRLRLQPVMMNLQNAAQWMANGIRL